MANTVYKGGSGSDFLPSQSGQSGKILGTVNEGLIWVPPVNVSGVFTTDSLFTWQQKTADFTAQNEYGYFVNSLGDVLVELPTSPSIGHTFQVISVAGRMAFDGKISGVLPPGNDYYYGTDATGKVIRFYYLDASYGWFCDSDLPNNLYMGDGDPFLSNVVLFLKGDGTNNSTNIIDSSLASKTPTLVGDVKIRTDQSKYGGSSIYFDGTSDALTFPANSDFNWFEEDYTAEAWIFAPSWADWSDGNRPRLLGLASITGDANYWSFGVQATGAPRFYYFNGSPMTLTSSTILATNQWHHIAISHLKGVGLFFGINGTVTGPISVSGTPQFDYTIVPTFVIGRDNASSITGWVDSLKLKKGIAMYTANYNPLTDTFSD
jgi:hypothetical protein